MRIHPFPALRPPTELAAEVASVPYDVVNVDEARAIAEKSPNSFMHVIRPEVDLPLGTDSHDDQVYAQAKRAFADLQERGALIREQHPCFYVYTQEAELNGTEVRQTGIVACCHVGDYNANKIKKHEKTRRDKEDDRTRHVLALRANAGPVFLTYRRDETVSELLRAAQRGEALYDFVADDDVRHVVHRVEDTAALASAFGAVELAYVADGHHRTASAARAGAALGEQNSDHTGEEEYNWFLSVLFAADELHILPYHRLVRDLNGLTRDQFLDALSQVGNVEEVQVPLPRGRGCVGVYVSGQWFHLHIDPASINMADAVDSLDYVLLYERVLAPILGIGDIRTDKRVDFVGGIRGVGVLAGRVDRGEAEVAFAMQATTMDQLMGVADAGGIMPPKSTWFEPKLRSGLLVHTLD